jgi:hypothetical protein
MNEAYNFIFYLNDLSLEEKTAVYEWVSKYGQGKTFKYTCRSYPAPPTCIIIKGQHFYKKPQGDEELLWSIRVGFDEKEIAMHFKLAHPTAWQSDTKKWVEA